MHTVRAGKPNSYDRNDLEKVHRVLWRGFDHGDEPPEDGIEDRRFMQAVPNFRHDPNIVVEAPDGNFATYCGCGTSLYIGLPTSSRWLQIPTTDGWDLARPRF